MRTAYHRSARATPWDDVAEPTAAQAIVGRAHADMYEQRHAPLAGSGEAAFLNGYEPAACPWCGSERMKLDGTDRNGVQRRRCLSCGRTFTPATGTIFDGRKLSVGEWVEFLLEVFAYESTNAVRKNNRRSSTTPEYWLHKLFLVLAGWQDSIVLSGTAWVDETYWPVDPSEVVRVDGRALRGLSRNKLCIGVGLDDGGRRIFHHEGRGKTSGAKTWDAFGGRVERGTLLVHDMEPAHNRLVRGLGLASEAHNAKEASRLPDKDNPLRPVNRECDRLKKFLRSHSGFRREDLQGWLDLFAVIRNPPEDPLEKVAWVLDRAMRNPVTLRYRDYYRVPPAYEPDLGDI